MPRRAKDRPCRCSAGSPAEQAGRMPRGSSSSFLHVLPPIGPPPTRSCGRAFAGRTPGDPLRLEDLAVHAIVLLLLAAVSANVATLIFARTAMRESEIVVRHALGASRARVIAQIVIESLVLTLTAAVLGLVVAQTTVPFAWARATLIIGDSLPFWVDLALEPVTVAYAL